MYKTIIILWVIFVLAGSFIAVQYHELSHYQIFESTGYENISIGYETNGFIVTGYTKAYPTNYSNSDLETILNSQNEIVGYHMTAFIINVWLIVIFIMLFIVLRDYGS